MKNRDKVDFAEKATKAGIAALAVGAVGKTIAHQKKNAQMQERDKQIHRINSQIVDIDRQINNYKSELLGSWLNDDKITQLEQKRKQLVEERKKYE